MITQAAVGTYDVVRALLYYGMIALKGNAALDHLMSMISMSLRERHEKQWLMVKHLISGIFLNIKGMRGQV